MKESPLERALAAQLKLLRVPEPQREYRFDPNRLWRFDFAWPALRLAAECEGGTFPRKRWRKVGDQLLRVEEQGAHVRGAHFQSDAEKYNAAVLAGWRVLRFTRKMIDSWEAARTIQKALSWAEYAHSPGPAASSQN
jgi:hypothetical protein